MKCTKCAKEFKELKKLNKQIKEKHGERFTCEVCNYTCGKKSDLMRHNRTAKHIQLTTGQVLKRKQPKHPQEPVEKVPKPQPEPVQGFEEKAALGCRLKQYVRPAEGQDPETYLNTKIDDIKKLVNIELITRKGIKVQLQLHIEFYKPIQPDLTCQFFGWSYQHTIHRGTTFKPQDMFPKVLKSIEEFTQRGSGWVINQLLELQVHIAVCRQLRGSTYKPLPKELKDKHAIVNVQNTDQKCFTWSILAKTHEVAHGENGKRVSKYLPFENTLNMDGIEYPVSLKQIDRFEKQNPFVINVFGYENKEVHRVRISNVTNQPWIHLMLLDGHYSLIKDLDKLLHDKTAHEHRNYTCPRCLVYRSTCEERRDEHLTLCSSHKPTKIKMPEDKLLKFTNLHKMLRQPAVVYADMECLTEPISTCLPNPIKSYTKYQRHTPCGYGLIAEVTGCCEKPKYGKLELYRGPNVIERFLTSIVQIATQHQLDINDERPMVGVDWQKHRTR